MSTRNGTTTDIPNSIPAGEIKRRGISAADDMLKFGPVYVIKNNRIEYIIFNREWYEEVLEDQKEAMTLRIRESLADIAAGRVQEMSVEEIMAEARAGGEE
ncbi:MAG: prevent-host-death protein [Tepidiformaceae bacterium]